MEHSRALRGPTAKPSSPIACRVCGKVFFDNLSLVLHFECHLEDETPSSGQLSLSLSMSPPPLSSMEGSSLAFPLIDNCPRALPLHAPSAYGQKSSQTIMSAGFSLPINHTTIFKKRALTSSSAARPLGPMASNDRHGRHRCFSGCNNVQVMQVKDNPAKEIVVISDDEEDEEVDGIDLTLKL